VIVSAGETVPKRQAKEVAKNHQMLEIRIKPRATDKIKYLDAYEEETLIIGPEQY